MKNESHRAIHWDDAPVFLAIARRGTLSGAADELGIGVATVSRRIERLERVLKLALFLRHQSGYTLTDEGRELLLKAEQLESAMHSFRLDSEPGASIQGHVRLATAENLANTLIIPTLSRLLIEHPKLTIDIVTDVSSVNLHRHDADLAVRMVRPTHGNLKVRRVGTLGFGLYGSTAYLDARRDAPNARNYNYDQFIGWSDRFSRLPAALWLEGTLRGRMPALTTSTLAAQLQAAKAGIGLAILPHFLAQEAGLQALPVELGIDQPIWLVVHSDLSESRRIRVVADHVVACIEQAAGRLEGNCPVYSERSG